MLRDGTNHWSKALARRIGLGGMVDFTATRVGQTLHVPCHRGHIVDFPISGNMPPDFVAKKMMQKGWSIGSHLLCPDHSKRPKIEKKEEPAMLPNEQRPAVIEMPKRPEGVELPAPVVTVKPSVAAGKARRLVYMALEDYYIEDKKLYMPGHSDATIAKSCDIAESVVKTIREESYGPLAAPPELAGYAEDLKMMRVMLTENMEKQRKSISDNAESLRQQIRVLELRGEALARKFG